MVGVVMKRRDAPARDEPVRARRAGGAYSQFSESDSPPLGVTAALYAWTEIEVLIIRTLPSHIRACTPPELKA